MNSDEEKQLFESWGWEYDYIERHWSSPRDPKVTLSTDELVKAATPRGEQWLKNVVRLHGVRQQEGDEA